MNSSIPIEVTPLSQKDIKEIFIQEITSDENILNFLNKYRNQNITLGYFKDYVNQVLNNFVTNNPHFHVEGFYDFCFRKYNVALNIKKVVDSQLITGDYKLIPFKTEDEKYIAFFFLYILTTFIPVDLNNKRIPILLEPFGVFLLQLNSSIIGFLSYETLAEELTDLKEITKNLNRIIIKK